MPRKELVGLPLLELVPALNPSWKPPYHLTDWCLLIEESLTGGMRAMCAMPFQHYKSTTTLLGVVWLLLRRPDLRIIVLTHSKAKAIAMGKELRRWWEAAGGELEKGFNTLEDWQTPQGGGCVIMSAEQSKLGYPCDVLLVDDPLDETEYLSREVRDTVDKHMSLYTARAATHLNSVLLVASRWHIDDPFGRRQRRGGWRIISHPGILDYGTPDARAFAPEVLTLSGHMQMRKEWSETDPSLKQWWAQVQNDPQPEELGGFANPVRGPVSEYGRFVIGVDLAYSDKPHADYFAMVVLKVWEKRAHVVNVARERRDLEMIAHRLHFARRTWPGAPIYTYYSGPERGALDYLESVGIPIDGMLARTPKYNRAQRTRDKWNQGEIVVPEQAPWAEGFIARVRMFTGNEAAGDDDEVDALVSACDGGVFCNLPVPTTFGKPRM